MKRLFCESLGFGAARLAGWLAISVLPAMAAQQSELKLSLRPEPNVSLRNEVKRAIDKGLAWLEKNQDTNGFWSTADHPAITAMVLTAFKLQPSRDQKTEPAVVKKG